MRRLFTFGCSFTEYRWPTWADILGQSFDYYENWGMSGTGNYLISSRIMECNHVNKITKDDVVIVMFTSIPRIDFYNGSWARNGNIYNQHSRPWEDQWRDNNWSFLQGFYNTWIAIKQTKFLLEQLGCEYTLLKAFNISTAGDELRNFNATTIEEDFLNEYSSDIERYFGTEPDMLSWIKNQDTPVYKFKKAGNLTNWIDYHPTIRHHELWVRTFLSKYYTKHVDVDLLEFNFPFEDNALLQSHQFNGVIKNNGNFLL